MVEIKESFKTRLEKALEYRQVKPVDLSRVTGISESTISQYRSGYSKPKDERLVIIANALHVDPAWLMGIDVPMVKKSFVPDVAAGEGCFNDGYPTETASVLLDADETLFTVHGRSMEPTLQDGDQVVVAATSVVESQNDIMLVKVNGEEHTLKHVKVTDDGVHLIAENPSVYPTRFFTADEVENLPVKISGVVTKLLRNLK